MRNEICILGYPLGKPWISSPRPVSPKHLSGPQTDCCGERFLRVAQTLSVSESLRLLLDGLIVDVARRFRSPGTQQGRLKALRLSGLGPPWTGRAESTLDQTVFIQHGLGKVSSSSHWQVLPAHACTADPHSPSKPGSVKIIHLVKWEESSRVTKVPFAESRRLLVVMESPSVIKKRKRKRKSRKK